MAAHTTHGNQWTLIAQNLPGRSATCVKNRWNWLTRHGVPQRFRQSRDTAAPDRRLNPVIETPRPVRHVALDALLVQDDFFGAHFREFQAKMMGGRVAENL
jgi:hypothetical protein